MLIITFALPLTLDSPVINAIEKFAKDNNITYDRGDLVNGHVFNFRCDDAQSFNKLLSRLNSAPLGLPPGFLKTSRD